MNALATAPLGRTMSVPPAPARIPAAYLSLISVSFYQLKQDLERLLRSGWDEAERIRAEELASTMTDACVRQGLTDVVWFTRSLTRLTRLSRAQVLPIRPAIREKIGILLREGDRQLSKHFARLSG
jgi:hypothetical protein